MNNNLKPPTLYLKYTQKHFGWKHKHAVHTIIQLCSVPNSLNFPKVLYQRVLSHNMH